MRLARQDDGCAQIFGSGWILRDHGLTALRGRWRVLAQAQCRNSDVLEPRRAEFP